MTVMFPQYFAVPQAVVRGGLWTQMKPSEIDLYIYLLEEVERCSTREMVRTDNEIRQSVGLSPRAACNARKKLQERGLILYAATVGNKYRYTLCDPATKLPYPGDPRQPVKYEKRSATDGVGRAVADTHTAEQQTMQSRIAGLPSPF